MGSRRAGHDWSDLAAAEQQGIQKNAKVIWKIGLMEITQTEKQKEK